MHDQTIVNKNAGKPEEKMSITSMCARGKMVEADASKIRGYPAGGGE